MNKRKSVNKMSLNQCFSVVLDDLGTVNYAVVHVMIEAISKKIKEIMHGLKFGSVWSDRDDRHINILFKAKVLDMVK